MRDVYQKGDFDLAGFAVGVVELKKVIAGPERVEAGDVVLGLASSGITHNPRKNTTMYPKRIVRGCRAMTYRNCT